MVTRAGWQCPGCSRFLSPDVQVCPCSDGGAGVLAPVRPLGDGGAGSYKVTAATGTITTGTTLTAQPRPEGWKGNVQMLAMMAG